MDETGTTAERSEPGDSEQDEEDVYEVESIIDMRMEEGEVLYRVRWKNYSSDDDTWEPEANLEDCMEVLLAFRRKVAESKIMKDDPVVEEAQAVGSSAVQEHQLAVASRGIGGAQEEKEKEKEEEEEKEEQVQLTASGLQRDLSPKKLPIKFKADSESDGDKKDKSPPRKKKKNLVEDLSPELHTKKKKKKKEKTKWKQEKVLPGPESDRSEMEDEDSVSTAAPPCAQNTIETKRALESDDDEEAVINPKKQKKEKSKDGGKHRRDESKDSKKPKKKSQEGKKRKDSWKILDSSEEECQSATAEGELSESSEPKATQATKSAGESHCAQGDELTTSKAKQKLSKPALKPQGIRDLIHEKKSKKPQAPPSQKETTRQKLKNLMNLKSHSKATGSSAEDELNRHSSDSSDTAAAISVKRKSRSKVLDTAIQGASSSPSSSSSCSSSSAAVITKKGEAKSQGTSVSGSKGKSSSSVKLEDSVEKDSVEKDPPASTNLFEKFLLNFEAKDRVQRRQSAHPTVPEIRAEQAKTATPKTTGKAEKKVKTFKESLAQKLVPNKIEKTKKDTKIPEAPVPAKTAAILEVEDKRQKSDRQVERRERTDTQEEQRKEEATVVPREIPGEVQERKEKGEEQRERRERTEDVRGCRGERKTTAVAAAEVPSLEPADEAGAPGRMRDRRRKREDSEPRLYIACEDNRDPQDLLGHTNRTKEQTPTDRGQTSLNIGVDLKLDWMTLEDFQKHLNGDNEIVSAVALSPSELRDAVKCGDYLAVKLALASKEVYNLDHEDSSGMSLTMLAAAGGQDDILRLLIKKGVKVNGRQKNGTTALMHAAEKNFLSTVAILLEAGAYVNAQTLGGETALMKACKRGNADVVRLLLEHGADCNILSKHQNNALHFAKLSNNVIVYDHVKDHMTLLSSVAEETIRAYFETRLALLEPVFPLACHRLCEGPDFSREFNYKPPTHSPVEGSGILLFVFHANFLSEITARLCGPCSVHAVVLNDKFQLPIFLDSHFIYSFSPVPGPNKLFMRLAESPTAKVKLLICAYRVQVQ